MIDFGSILVPFLNRFSYHVHAILYLSYGHVILCLCYAYDLFMLCSCSVHGMISWFLPFIFNHSQSAERSEAVVGGRWWWWWWWVVVVGGGGGWWWPTGFYCQPQSPLGLIGVGTGLDWDGVGPGGIGD